VRVEKFTGSDMREAMAAVRSALGKDAMILSSRRVNDLTEITAAMDFDPAEPAHSKQLQKIKLHEANPQLEELTPGIQQIQGELGRLRRLFEGELAQLAWRDQNRRQPNRQALIARLELAGIVRTLATDIVDTILPCDDIEQGWRKALGLLGGRICTWRHDIVEEGGVIALMGSTGVGKTITAAKLAARFALQHGRRHVAFISTDKYKVGGQEQLVALGGILGIPVQLAANADQMQRTLDSLSERKLVIIDTAGMSQRDMTLADQFDTLQGGERIKPMLVLPATARETIINETIQAFSRIEIAAAVLTKTDECDAMGPVLSCILQHRLPLAFTTNGQKIPDDLHRAAPKVLLADVIRTYKQQQRLQRAVQEQDAPVLTH
jgi:flagellar biosynthesis protein FlhF